MTMVPNQHEAVNGVNRTVPLLQVTSLGKTYRMAGAELPVLRDVSFALQRGDTCAILGPSGSGKTTLLGLSAGLDRATTGTVRLNGQDLGALDENARAALRNTLIGFIFQNFQLIPTLTALENVMVPLELRGGNPAPEPAIALLTKVGLGERLRHYPTQLSAGEQQRVALARAFIHRPEILFADEPTGNLDAETGHQVIETMFELNRAAGTALVLVTHDLELAQRTQRIIRLRSGRVIDDTGKAGNGS
ncbi:MAG: Lipoprotein-releasing system ATP-binding protein LolD [Verrucomicrobiae bacterium]|nr:Lipoprotein-releasing system ATP-binding protein LolD [Verrucomicrobiae bacterium]